MSLPRPVSLVAERAVRLLRELGRPASSLDLARELLATRAPDEPSARRLLAAAFSGDPRLTYDDGRWTLAGAAADAATSTGPGADARPAELDPDRALIFLDGERPGPGEPYRLRSISALRLRGRDVVAACGGDAAEPGERLRRAILDTLTGAVPVTHATPAAYRALERWLDTTLDVPVSLRRLAVDRVGIPASHDLEALAARLGLSWQETDDPLLNADVLDACLASLRGEGETLDQLRAASTSGAPPIDWSRLGFDRDALRHVPPTPGTYRFFDRQGRLIYVGKSKNLQQRLASYFREGRRRSPRVQRLLDTLHRFDYEVVGSELEAVLREAAAIRREAPLANVQRELHARAGRGTRLSSILILEPAAAPSVLRAFLIRDGALVARVPIGPRGGGLRRIERVLEDHFFSIPDGPTPPVGPDLDVELVVRWLAANRERTVAFDPTSLRSSREVIERLRWFLEQGSPFDPDGLPIAPR